MAKNQNKDALVDAIQKKLKCMEMASSLREASRLKPRCSFSKDINTIPRLLNILSEHLNDLLKSKEIAKWTDLQSGTMHSGNPLWTAVTSKFNDPNFYSGGLVTDDSRLDEIDPDSPHLSRGLTADLAYFHWNNTKKEYAHLYSNFNRSGINTTDFWPFCSGKTDVFYMHLWLQSHGREDVLRFCRECIVIPSGFDETPRSTPRKTLHDKDSPRISCGEKRRSPDDELVECLLKKFKNPAKADVENTANVDDEETKILRLIQLEKHMMSISKDNMLFPIIEAVYKKRCGELQTILSLT
jgi:hypothetical protein